LPTGRSASQKTDCVSKAAQNGMIRRRWNVANTGCDAHMRTAARLHAGEGFQLRKGKGMKKSTSKVNRLFMGIAALAMAGAMAVAFAGCGQQQSGGSDASADTSAPVAAAADTSAPAAAADTSAAAAAPASIKCKMVIDESNIDKGVVFEMESVYKEGVSAYDVLVDSGVDIGVDSSSGTVYVDSIAGLSASETGPNAGWLFYVNGEMPTVGASDYIVKDGDEIVWTFYEDAMAAF